ncbi:MAG: Tol biopolymer transport system component [Myxococcota bacterium]|jgi:Tol biopolymer transport system component
MPMRVGPGIASAIALLLCAPATALGATVLEVAAVDGANLQRPSWSPDATRLSYEANYHQVKTIELYVGDPENRTFRRLKGARRSTTPITAGFVTATPATQVVNELAWGRGNGSGYVFSAAAETQDFDLYMDGGGAIAIAPGADGGPKWSPDGARLVFTSARTGDGDLYVLSADTMEAAPKRVTSAAGSSELFADWSPDSRSLVYVAHGDTGDHVWLLPTLDGEPRQLTTEPGSQVRPTFSPDGKRVAYYSMAPPGSPDALDQWALVVRELGADAVPVVLAEDVKPDLSGPAWTPSGDHLIAVRNDPDALDPVAWVPATPGGETIDIDLGTVNHGDVSVVASGGALRLAFIAQGRVDDAVRAFKRLYMTTLPVSPPAQ